MTSPSTGQDPLFRGLRCLILVLLGALFAYLIWTACRLQVDPFDSYSIYNNAMTFLERVPIPYVRSRPVLLPLLATVFLGAGVTPELLLVLTRLTALAFFGGLLWVAYKLFCLHLEKKTALAGVALLALNPLLIHYAPFYKEDIPGALFTLAAFYLYLRPGPKTWKSYFAIGVCITAAINTRFHLPPLIWFVLGGYEILSGRLGTRLGRKFLFFCLMPVAVFFLIPTLLYVYLDLAPSLPASFLRFCRELLFHLNSVSGNKGTYSENYAFIVLALTWPGVLLALFGFGAAWIRKKPGALFHTLWFVVFFLVQTYCISHKEARLLMPLFIPCAYFTALGLAEAIHLVQKPFGSGGRRRFFTGAIFSALVLAIPVKQAVGECLKFTDPFYTTAYAKEVSREAARLAGENQVHWVGPMYPLHAKDYLFHPDDEFTYLYHFYNHVVRFWTRKKLKIYNDPEIFASTHLPGVFVFQIGEKVEDGDVIILNPEEESHDTGTLPPTLRPLIVERIRTVFFSPGPDKNTFLHKDNASVKLRIEEGGQDFTVRGEGLPDGFYELYLLLGEKEQRLSYGLVRVRGGQFDKTLQRQLPANLKKLMLLGYDRSSVHPHP